MIRWLIYLPFALIIQFFAMAFTPLACLFVTKRERTDYVKRLGTTVTMQREYLMKYVYWFQPHDNPVDQLWYGLYDDWLINARKWSQDDYDRNPFIRYYCRVRWCWRNPAYGFHYALFSIDKEEMPWRTFEDGAEDQRGGWLKLDVYQHYFQFQLQIPDRKDPSLYRSINIGWKSHKAMPKTLYANRIYSSLRKYS